MTYGIRFIGSRDEVHKKYTIALRSIQSLWGVYNRLFAETKQATMHQHDVILHAVLKVGTWVTAGSFTE